MKILLVSLFLLFLSLTPRVFAQELPADVLQRIYQQQQLQQPQQPQTQSTLAQPSDWTRRVENLEQGLRDKQKENKQIINWIVWWWWIGFFVGWAWFFVWIFIGWQWWKIGFWGFRWPWPRWFFIPLVWFIPWVIWGLSNKLVWWIPWVWGWWIFPWIFWIFWWLIVFKEAIIWIWKKK